MTENEATSPGTSGAVASAAKRKSKTTTKRKTAARKKPAAGSRRPRRASPRGSGGLEKLMAGWSRRAAQAGNRLAAISEEGVSGARRTLRKAGVASRKTIDHLTREWKGMDTVKRAQFVAALLGALAAASAPLVGHRLKKK